MRAMPVIGNWTKYPDIRSPFEKRIDNAKARILRILAHPKSQLKMVKTQVGLKDDPPYRIEKAWVHLEDDERVHIDWDEVEYNYYRNFVGNRVIIRDMEFALDVLGVIVEREVWGNDDTDKDTKLA